MAGSRLNNKTRSHALISISAKQIGRQILEGCQTLLPSDAAMAKRQQPILDRLQFADPEKQTKKQHAAAAKVMMIPWRAAAKYYKQAADTKEWK
jgi:hypothetical protein